MMSDSIEKKIDALTDAFTKHTESVDERFDILLGAVGMGFNRVHERLDTHGEKIDRVQTRVGAIENRLDVISDDIRVLKTFKENQEEYKIPERVKRLEKTAGIESS